MAVQPSQLEHPGFLPHLLWGTPTGPPPALSQWSPVRALLGGGVGQALGLSVSGASSVWLSLEGFSQPWARGFLGKCPGYRIQEGPRFGGLSGGLLGNQPALIGPRVLSVNPLRAGAQSFFHLGVPSLQSQNLPGRVSPGTVAGGGAGSAVVTP